MRPYQSIEKSLPPAAQQYVDKLKTLAKQAGTASTLSSTDLRKILGAPSAEAEPSPQEPASQDVDPIRYSPGDVDDTQMEPDDVSGLFPQDSTPPEFSEPEKELPSLGSLAKQTDEPPAGLPRVAPQPQDPGFGTPGPSFQMPPENPVMNTTPSAPANMQHNTSAQLHPSAVPKASQTVTMDPRMGRGSPKPTPTPVSMNPADPTASPAGANDPANLARIRQNLLRRSQ